MRKLISVLGSAIFLVIAPGFIAGVVPFWISRWRMEPPFFGSVLFRALGIVLLGLGTLGLIDSFGRFALQGLGTPAPVLPTRHLVVTGLYRYVRNPMYVGVASVIFGQAFLLGNVALLEYGAAVSLAFHLFVLGYEEPRLRATFGSEYDAFRVGVPRWIPRVTPWKPAPPWKPGPADRSA